MENQTKEFEEVYSGIKHVSDKAIPIIDQMALTALKAKQDDPQDLVRMEQNEAIMSSLKAQLSAVIGYEIP